MGAALTSPLGGGVYLSPRAAFFNPAVPRLPILFQPSHITDKWHPFHLCVSEGAKNRKAVTHNEKLFPSGSAVFNRSATTHQTRRMEVAEGRLFGGFLRETYFDWRLSVVVTKISAFYWLPNSHIFFQLASTQPAAVADPAWDTETLGKKHTKTAKRNRAERQVSSKSACKAVKASAAFRISLARVTRILIMCPWLFSELLLTFKTYCMANWWKIKPL